MFGGITLVGLLLSVGIRGESLEAEGWDGEEEEESDVDEDEDHER